MNRPVYSLVGWSGSGKTTLLEKLLPLLRREGLTVAVVKHDGHEFEMDEPGRDSWRMARAGAEVSAVFSATHAAILENRPLTIEEMVARLRDVDLVLTEGGKSGPYPKIGVAREKRLPPVRGSYVLVMSDRPVQTDAPVLDINDAQGLADFLCRDIARRSGALPQEEEI